MTSTTIDAAGPGLLAEEAAGPLEQRHLQYANYRAVADGSKVTRTHWHIALANGLGWGFDGMVGVIFALISPLVIKEFALDIPTYRTGFQIWLTLGITGLYFWPWLSDRLGRRSLLAVNIAIFSLMMPIVALSRWRASMIARAWSTSALTIGKTRQIRAVLSSEAVSTRAPDGSNTALRTAAMVDVVQLIERREYMSSGALLVGLD